VGGRWGYISGEIVYEYNYYNDNYYTDLYGLLNPYRRDAGLVKVKWMARAGKTLYPYGKYKRELYTHGTQYSSPAGISLGTLGWICEIFYNNPHTGIPWTIAEVDDLLAGITLGKGGGFGIPYCDCLQVIVLWANAEVQTDLPFTLAEDQVRLRGTVIEDEAEDCQVYFEYGPDDSYGNTTTPVTKAKGDSLQADITLAAPVHFRSVIETACGETFFGSDRLWTGRGVSGRSVADKLVAKGAI
jgi:hypothetical protein